MWTRKCELLRQMPKERLEEFDKRVQRRTPGLISSQEKLTQTRRLYKEMGLMTKLEAVDKDWRSGRDGPVDNYNK